MQAETLNNRHEYDLSQKRRRQLKLTPLSFISITDKKKFKWQLAQD